MRDYLKEQQRRIGNDIKRRISKVYDHCQFIRGPEVQELEDRLADYIGVKHCITCASGTDALTIACRTLYGSNQKINIPTFTFAATAEAVKNSGNIISFNDIDILTWCGGEGVHVELFGCPSSRKYPIGDCAQSFGAEFMGKSSFLNYKIACTSFFPSKPLGCYGDGGACFTNDDDLALEIRSLCNHGAGDNKYDNISVGFNSRLDTVQAAVLLSKLDIFDSELQSRRIIAQRYKSNLYGSGVVPQTIPGGGKSACAILSFIAECGTHRSKIVAKLTESGYKPNIYYPKPLNLHIAYYNNGNYAVSKDISERIFSVPFHPYIDNDDIDKICEVIWKTT